MAARAPGQGREWVPVDRTGLTSHADPSEPSEGGAIDGLSNTVDGMTIGGVGLPALTVGRRLEKVRALTRNR